MKISYKTDYALKIVLDLSRHYSETLVRIEELSKRQDIPRKFLEQLLLALKKGGFIQSKRGPKGGYYLAREPGKILLGEVVRFVSGSVYPISCIDPSENQECDFKSKCVFAGIWKKIGNEITNMVDSISFAHLVEKERKLLYQPVLDYQI
jgi:Rrf2 family protein